MYRYAIMMQQCYNRIAINYFQEVISLRTLLNVPALNVLDIFCNNYCRARVHCFNN